MVQINEIRYKNYFETVKHSSIIQISGFRTYSTDKPLVRYENHGGEYGLDQIKPIPLTEEWLLKFGFKKSGYFFTLTGFYHQAIMISIDLEKTLFGDNEEYEIKHIRFVHEVQNLFFSLVGEELVFSSTEP